MSLYSLERLSKDVKEMKKNELLRVQDDMVLKWLDKIRDRFEKSNTAVFDPLVRGVKQTNVRYFRAS